MFRFPFVFVHNMPPIQINKIYETFLMSVIIVVWFQFG